MFAKSDIIRYTKCNKEADAIVLVWIFNVGQEIYISSKYWQGDLWILGENGSGVY